MPLTVSMSLHFLFADGSELPGRLSLLLRSRIPVRPWRYRTISVINVDSTGTAADGIRPLIAAAEIGRCIPLSVPIQY